MSACTLKDPHDCANVRAANSALRRHLDAACNERDRLRANAAAFTDCESGVLAAVRSLLIWADVKPNGEAVLYRKYVDDLREAVERYDAAPREPGHAAPSPGPGAAAQTPPLGSPRIPPPQVASERVNATVPPGDEPLAKTKDSA